MGKKAPSVYYEKQRFFRLGYGVFTAIHYILTVGSVVFAHITIYIVVDGEFDTNMKLVISVAAAIFNVLQIVLRCDKISEGYIMATRVLEQAILRYEYADDPAMKTLLDANKESEE